MQQQHQFQYDQPEDEPLLVGLHNRRCFLIILWRVFCSVPSFCVDFVFHYLQNLFPCPSSLHFIHGYSCFVVNECWKQLWWFDDIIHFQCCKWCRYWYSSCYPLPSCTGRGHHLFLILLMLSVGINQLSLVRLARPADYFGCWFIPLIGANFLVLNLAGNIGTFVLFLGMSLAMFWVQLIFYGVGLLRTQSLLLLLWLMFNIKPCTVRYQGKSLFFNYY